jgi:hypothetical protein
MVIESTSITHPIILLLLATLGVAFGCLYMAMENHELLKGLSKKKRRR